jgi:DNA-binding CsgD family transcriptional regulator
MPDGCKLTPDSVAAFPLRGAQMPTSLQDIQRDLARAWRLTLASQIGQALVLLEAIERRLGNLSPEVARRYRAASLLVRSVALAFQGDGLEGLAIVISEVFAEVGVPLGAPVPEAYRRTEKFEPIARSLSTGSEQFVAEGDLITARERDVLSMISQGCSNKRIARILKISPETVKSHVERIFSKLSVSARTEAVSRAVSQGLL